MKPMNGQKTHPLSDHALTALRSLVGSDRPAQEVNPGVVNRLLRGGLVELTFKPTPYKSRTGTIQFLRITDAGRAVLEATGVRP